MRPLRAHRVTLISALAVLCACSDNGRLSANGDSGTALDAGRIQDADKGGGRDVACPAVCELYCQYGHAVDSNGCELCECKPAPVDTGTTKDAGPFICPPVCAIDCPNGNVRDSDGCPTCECNAQPTVCPAIKCKACPFGYLKDANGCDTCDCAADPARSDCAAIADRLASEMQSQQSQPGGCTAVVRLDYATLDILSYAFVCGRYAATDETAARNSANAAAVFPYASGAGSGKLLTGPSPTDQWVFYSTPSDFGGVAAVSDTTGLTTFAGTIVWAGTGKILIPASFSSGDLGKGCDSSSPSSVRGVNLVSSEADPRMEEAAAIVQSTALRAAFTRLGGVFGIVILAYPRTVGAFDASTAEYIVLFDGGWLE